MSQNKEDIDALVSYAHKGAINIIAEAQRRLILLERFNADAILFPSLHNFDPSYHQGELSAETQRANLLATIEQAKRIGLLCEKFKGKQDEAILRDLFDNLKPK